MGVIEASDRAWKVVQMKGEKQGVSAWLRGIIDRYKDEADGFSRGCSAMVNERCALRRTRRIVGSRYALVRLQAD